MDKIYPFDRVVRNFTVSENVSLSDKELSNYLKDLVKPGEKVFRVTRSICPDCEAEGNINEMMLDAVLVEKNDEMLIKKKCSKHGIIEDTYWHSANKLKEGIKHVNFGRPLMNPDVKKGIKEISCPTDCGLCSKHKSHTALANIALSNRCPLSCWYCFFYCKEGEPIYEPSLAQIRNMCKNLRNERPVAPNCLQLSIDYNETVLLKDPEGNIVSKHIGEFVEGLMEKDKPKTKSEPIKHEELELVKNNWQVLSIDKNEPCFREVKSVIRHKNKEDLYELESDNGWKIKTTGAHSVFVLDENAEIIPKNVSEITQEDTLIGALNIPSNDKVLTEINLIDLINEKKPEIKNKIRVCDFSKEDLKEYEKEFNREINWYSVSLIDYERSKVKAGNSIMHFNSKKEKVLPINLKFTPELFRLLGYYVGEGCQYKNGLIFTFGLKEKKMIKDFIECLKSVFGETNYRKRVLHGSALQIIIEGYLYKEFFDLLEAGKGSKTKAVPWIVFNVSNKLKKEFLKAYFNCDGNVRMRKVGYEIVNTTVSKKLASDLLLLNNQLGIIAQIHESTSKPHLIKKTGQRINVYSTALKVTIRGKKELEKALWYLEGDTLNKFKKYCRSVERHAPKYLRMSSIKPVKDLVNNKVKDSRISYLLKRVKYDKSVFLNNLREITDYFNANNIEFNKNLNDLSHGNIGLFKIKKIKRIKPSNNYVYDLSVPKTQAFFAGRGSLLAHNTGGEPTVRDDLLDIIRICKEEGFEHVQLNTYGKAFAHDPDLAREITEAGANVSYMSFDGVSEKTNAKNFWEVPAALDNLAEGGANSVVLVPTVIKGVNDHELGDILRFAAANMHIVRGVNFQPVSFVGRMPKKLRDKQRITIPKAIDLIEWQTNGQIVKEDFFSVPCVAKISNFIEAASGKPEYKFSNHFACGAATYVFMEGKNFLPLPRFFDVEGFFEYLDELAGELNKSRVKLIGKLVTGGKLLMKINSFVEKEKSPQQFDFAKLLTNALVSKNYQGLKEFHHKSLFLGMMHFMDLYNYDADRVERCNIHYAMPNNTIIPFCAYNVIPSNYRDKVQREFSVDAEEFKKKTGLKIADDKWNVTPTEEEKEKIRARYESDIEKFR